MLRGYSFNNFKAFSSGNIEIKPITVFIGGNSSGKSSVSHIPLLLHQTATSELVNKYGGDFCNTLVTNGTFVSFGDPLSLISGKNKKRRLALNIDLKTTDEINNELKDVTKEFYSTIWETLRLYFTLIRENNEYKNISDDIKQILESPTVIYQEQYKNTILDKLGKLKAISEKIESTHSEDSIIFQRFSKREKKLVSRKDIKSKDDYSLSFQLIETIKKIRWNDIQLSFEFKYDNKRHDMSITKMSIYSGDFQMLTADFDPDTRELVNIDFPFIEKNILTRFRMITKLFNNDKTIFDVVVENDFLSNDPLFPELLNKILLILIQHFKNSFEENRIYYVGPLRDYPKKYYVRWLLSQGKNLKFDENMSEILFSNKNLLRKTNKWLKNFDTQIEISEANEDIHRILAIRNSQPKMDLDISDVGFGISQILPVVLQTFLSSSDSITIIEQPEIHLHPNMQSKLADLFIDAVIENRDLNKKLVIETHSVPLMVRLRLRCAQNIIKQKDIAVYKFSVDNNNKGVIKKVPLTSHGEFSWPVEFIDEELKDEIEFAKIISG